MTQLDTARPDSDLPFGERRPARQSPSAPPPTAETLDRVRDTALRFVADVARPPTALRLRIGEVSFEAEWPGPGQPAPMVTPAAAVVPAAASGLPAAPPEQTAGPAAPDGIRVTAPTVGVFYHASEPGAAPFVQVGDVVAPGDQVGIVETMKLMIPVEADTAGRVEAVLVGNGESVEFGEALLALVPVR